MVIISFAFWSTIFLQFWPLFCIYVLTGSSKVHHIVLYKSLFVIIYTYYTTKMDITEYFRPQLSQFMSVIMRNIIQYIKNSGYQCEVGKSNISLHISRWMRDIIYSLSKPEYVYSRSFLTMKWFLMSDAYNFFFPYEPSQLEIWLFYRVFFIEQ